MVGRRKSPPTLTPLEMEIMQVLWETGPANVQTVQAGLKTDPPLAYTTVQTMLNVLHRKGKVKRKLNGRAFDYAPTVTREKATSHAVREMVERLFGGSVDGLLMNLVNTRQLDAAKIAELAERVERETGVKRVPPNKGGSR
jgi:BlaI family transcriptional regulator, penicillinase repressor